MTAVSVIVPSYAGGGRLERLLQSLAEQTTEHEAIVVDNGSRDGAVAGVVPRFAGVELLRLDRNEGFSRAVNIAARRAEGDAIVLVNDDCVCEPGFVEGMAAALDPAAGIAMAAGVLRDPRHPSLIDTAGMELDRTLLVFDYLNGEPVTVLEDGVPDPVGPCGAAAAFDRRVFLDAGGFDEALFAYWEDVDLVLRLRRGGARCRLARRALGTHEHSATLGSGSAGKNYLTGYGRGYVLRKWGVLRSPRRLAAALVRDAAICGGQAIFDRNLAGVRGRLRGFNSALATEQYPIAEIVPAQASGVVSTLRRRAERRRRLRHRAAPSATGWRTAQVEAHGRPLARVSTRRSSAAMAVSGASRASATRRAEAASRAPSPGSSRRRAIERASLRVPPPALLAGAGLALVASVALAAIEPAAAVALALLIAVIGLSPRVMVFATTVVAAGCLAILNPRLGAVTAGSLTALAAYRLSDRRAIGVRVRLAIAALKRTLGRLLPVIAVAASCATLFVWPIGGLLMFAVVGIAMLSLRAPPLALGAALLLSSFEGTIKYLLAVQGSPLSINALAAGAFALDLALALAVVGLLRWDRGRSLALTWRQATGAERAALIIVGGWLAVSAFQIAQGGDLIRGVQGFRLTQAYTLVAVAGLIVARNLEPRRWLPLLVGGIALVCGYAALRTVTGVSASEQGFVLVRDPAALFGTTFRSVGSFQSAVALASFVTPALVFTGALGLLLPQWRRLCWTAALLALVGAVGSYARVSLVAIVVGLMLAVVLAGWFEAGGGRTARMVTAMLALIAIGAAGVVAASQTSSIAAERARGLIDPAGDASLQERLHTWDQGLSAFSEQPLGRGIGTVGRASGDISGTGTVTTDNSFLKVLVEQGVIGVALFAGGLVILLVGIGARLFWARSPNREVGLAALSGFVAFVALWFAGEYIEQPGKVLAWLLLGVAIAEAFEGTTRRGSEERAVV